MSFLLPAIIGAVGSLAGSAMQAGAARRATDAQVQASRDQIKFAKETRDLSRQDLAPFRRAGQNALMRYSNNINRPFRETQAYRFQFNEGLDALNRSLAAQGRSLSGDADMARIRYGQGVAGQEYGNYLNRLSNLGSMGLGAATGQAGFTQTAGNQINQSIGARGNALAAGSIAQGNAWANGLGSMGQWAGYLQASQPQLFQQADA